MYNFRGQQWISVEGQTVQSADDLDSDFECMILITKGATIASLNSRLREKILSTSRSHPCIRQLLYLRGH